jgi:glucose-6-phosphate isomerase
VKFEPGFDIAVTSDPLGFKYGKEVFGPSPELRRLDSIRPSLRDASCSGPDPVYAIAMDVGLERHRTVLLQRNLLFGVVIFAAGRLGDEPVRSQGHVHKVSSHSGWSPPELYEIWTGHALIYLQESAADNPGRCFAIDAWPGDRVVVPPGWAHATVNANPKHPMAFGAWCDREYGFVYEEVRKRNGLAWYPLVTSEGTIEWYHNSRYELSMLHIDKPRQYAELGLAESFPIYKLIENNPDSIQWISKPALVEHVWRDFRP